MSYKLDDKLNIGTDLMQDNTDNGAIRTLDTSFTTPTFASKPSGLGRGLSALMGESKSNFVKTDDSQAMIQTHKLTPTKFQPRTEFNDDNLKELSESISKNGIIQPLTVRPTGTAGEYEIVAGERRWRAAKLLNLPTVPVIIKELADKDVMEIALVENIQRQDLSPLEEAQAYRRLLGEFGYVQEDLSRTVGKSRSHIANLLRLLSLPEEVKNMLKDGSLSAGHARALLGCNNPVALAQKIVAEGLSVRQTEKLTDGQKGKAKKGKVKGNKDSDIKAIEDLLFRNLSAKVSIKSQGKKGQITISYESLEQLDALISALSVSKTPVQELEQA